MVCRVFLGLIAFSVGPTRFCDLLLARNWPKVWNGVLFVV